MGLEPPVDLRKAGERPARVRTGAKTATKTQEREMLDKFEHLAQHPEALLPTWRGSGRDPFQRLERKLRRVQALRGKERRLRWAARGKNPWNAYAATLLVLEGGKIPSFASLRFQNRDVKYVYRTGTQRNALIGVQLYDDPDARLLGYHRFAKRQKLYLMSGEDGLLAVRKGDPAPVEFLQGMLRRGGVDAAAHGSRLSCPHAEASEWRFEYRVPELSWTCELCLKCVAKAGGTFHELLDERILGPHEKVPVETSLRGLPFAQRPEGATADLGPLVAKAYQEARAEAEEKYAKYSDVELAQWTQERLARLLAERPEGFLLVGNELWLSDYPAAARAYLGSDLERRALELAFSLEPPRFRVGDKSLHKLLEPYWKEHANRILQELSSGLLKQNELQQIERLNPSEAIAALARILGARERFKEFLQFDDLDPSLDFVLTCIQIQRSGERGVLSEKLHSGARNDATRILTLAVARQLGEQTNLEWQYAPHEKESASFLDPYVRGVVNAAPAEFAKALGKLAVALGVPAPKARTPATT